AFRLDTVAGRLLVEAPGQHPTRDLSEGGQVLGAKTVRVLVMTLLVAISPREGDAVPGVAVRVPVAPDCGPDFSKPDFLHGLCLGVHVVLLVVCSPSLASASMSGWCGGCAGAAGLKGRLRGDPSPAFVVAPAGCSGVVSGAGKTRFRRPWAAAALPKGR